MREGGKIIKIRHACLKTAKRKERKDVGDFDFDLDFDFDSRSETECTSTCVYEKSFGYLEAPVLF